MNFDLKLKGFIERQNYEWHANKQKSIGKHLNSLTTSRKEN